ncbi:hypothetical protein TNCV_575931, partial [Trichonephila clavipes]
IEVQVNITFQEGDRFNRFVSDLFSVWFGNSSKTIIKQGADSSNGP